MLAVVDTGPLYAVVDASDQDHQRSLETLQSPHLRLFVPAMVVAEATYLVGRRLGTAVEAAFLACLPALGTWSLVTQLSSAPPGLLARWLGMGRGH